MYLEVNRDVVIAVAIDELEDFFKGLHLCAGIHC